MQPTFKISKLEAWHLASIDIQEHQKYFAEKCKDAQFRVALAMTGGVTGYLDFGEEQPPKIIAIAGIIPYEEGVGMGWSVLSKNFPSYATRCTREIKRYCAEQLKSKYHRIEIQTETAFKPANRWAEMLGFKFESIRRQGGPFRQDMSVYTMIREG